MNHKNERIKKLLDKGMTLEKIAKKTGLSIERVKVGIEWIKRQNCSEVN